MLDDVARLMKIDPRLRIAEHKGLGGALYLSE
jgi:hypothetical protein